MIRLLVTGASGFIGSHTCVLLLEKGYEIIALDSYVNSSPKTYKKILEILTEKLLTTREILKDKLSSEAALRREYSSLNESFALVEHFIESSKPSSFQSNYYLNHCFLFSSQNW